MSIKAKILATVIPLIIVPLLFISIISTNQAKIGITKVAQQLLAQKLEELSKKVSSQYDMLEQLKTGGIANEDPEMLDAVYKEIQYYCESLFRNSQLVLFESFEIDFHSSI
ncbi:MAG TPA: hypothetical protein PLN45_03065, partial [Exilispira sp.]|nr:hypothetical protein [Exilispira sp.]